MAFIPVDDDQARRTGQRRAAILAIGLFVASWTFVGWFAADAGQRTQTLAFVFGPGPAQSDMPF